MRLAEVGLAQRVGHYPGQLSGGEQRAWRSRALSNHPQLLLADEPTGNLDQATGREIVELLFRVQRERRMTLLLITHELHSPAAAPISCTWRTAAASAGGRARRPRAVSGGDGA